MRRRTGPLTTSNTSRWLAAQPRPAEHLLRAGPQDTSAGYRRTLSMLVRRTVGLSLQTASALVGNNDPHRQAFASPHRR